MAFFAHNLVIGQKDHLGNVFGKNLLKMNKKFGVKCRKENFRGVPGTPPPPTIGSDQTPLAAGGRRVLKICEPESFREGCNAQPPSVYQLLSGQLLLQPNGDGLCQKGITRQMPPRSSSSMTIQYILWLRPTHPFTRECL